jgi:hypothetical protein
MVGIGARDSSAKPLMVSQRHLGEAASTLLVLQDWGVLLRTGWWNGALSLI